MLHTLPSAPDGTTLQPLQGVRIVSLALNLPGPAALMRCHQMGATCTKLEPLAADPQVSADPMQHYSPAAYSQLHAGIAMLPANLKTEAGQALLHAQLADTDVLLTSFRPHALDKLGLAWERLHAQYPQLCMVHIYGSTSPGAANHPGHDLTYQAEAGLLDDVHMPASLFADMAGALMASEAVMQTLLARARSGHGQCLDIGLAQAAQWLALPRHWQMSTLHGDVGGAHAGYRLYRCADGWVAVAALEPHFAQRLCLAAGLDSIDGNVAAMREEHVHNAIERFMRQSSAAAMTELALQRGIPLQAICKKHK